MRMEKRGMACLGKVLLVLLFFVLMNVGFWSYSSYKNGGEFSSSGGLTGMSITDSVKATFVGLSLTQKIVFFIQLFVVLLIIFFLVAREIGKRRRNDEISRSSVVAGSKGKGTDLDSLYAALKQKKKIHLSSISRGFKVSRDTAMEWCKILESSNLASIEYPALGESYIRIIEEENKEKENGKEKVKK